MHVESNPVNVSTGLPGPTAPGTQVLWDLGLIYAAAVWGSTFVLVKQAIAGVHPVLLVGYRFLIASALMCPVCLRNGRAAGHSAAALSRFLPGIIVGAVLWLIYVPQTIGLVYTSAANSAFITGLFVVFVPLFGLTMFQIRPSGRDLAAVVLATIGLYILTGRLQEMNLGDAITLVTAAAYALHLLLTDKYIRGGVDPFELCMVQFAVTGILSVAVAIGSDISLAVRSSHAFWAIVFLAVFPTVSAFLIQALAQRHTSPIKVALIFSLEPVFAALFAWTWGGEAFLMQSAAGGGLIVSGMILSALPKPKAV